jgi:hypothetical protein
MEKRHIWFYRHCSWNGATYYWPCHWMGALLMLAAMAVAFSAAGVIIELSRVVERPGLGWLSIIAVVATYSGFDQIADRHARS